MPPAAISIFGFAYAGGIAAMFAAGRFREIALLCVPLVAAALANLLGYWPYGAFRPNLFLIPGALLVIGAAMDWLATRRQFRFAAYAIVVAVLGAVLRIDLHAYGTKSSAHWSASPQLTEVLDDIDRRRRADPGDWNEVLVADWHSWRPLAYYLPRYPGLRDRLRLVRGPLADLDSLQSRIEEEIDAARRAPRATRLWIVVTQLDAHGAIGSSSNVDALDVYRREFAAWDRHYHPVLTELFIDPR